MRSYTRSLPGASSTRCPQRNIFQLTILSAEHSTTYFQPVSSTQYLQHSIFSSACLRQNLERRILSSISSSQSLRLSIPQRNRLVPQLKPRAPPHTLPATLDEISRSLACVGTRSGGVQQPSELR